MQRSVYRRILLPGWLVFPHCRAVRQRDSVRTRGFAVCICPACAIREEAIDWRFTGSVTVGITGTARRSRTPPSSFQMVFTRRQTTLAV